MTTVPSSSRPIALAWAPSPTSLPALSLALSLALSPASSHALSGQLSRTRRRCSQATLIGVLVAGSGMGLAHAAQGADASVGGNFEPTVALQGDGWHWLSADPKAVVAEATVPASLPASLPPPVPPTVSPPVPPTVSPTVSLTVSPTTAPAVATSAIAAPLGAVEPAAPLSGPTATTVAPASMPPASAGGHVAGQTMATLAPLPQAWRISPQDQNYRLLMQRWSAEAGWTAGRWELDQDVPIEASTEIVGDFKTAVRRVLSATELTDYSLKPCFYSNSLVRVVKVTTKCDPSK
ncbi:toxin co-regulated pilus biosynthesis Q family protein [Cupriavidus pauculus]|uniref:toxin co-regulated pilus biosynthesis Q family protein n=1 Tax=Cupriavidus pauculus TaxID=82633 RepID=UPI001EE269E0|nr:toxin co-regulated pilus biosynthesis Q family protein [Cupriavidus pauculus]GJG97755.1 hypothetical protein CBA19C6_24720 [Cupriavidus pauculus]